MTTTRKLLAALCIGVCAATGASAQTSYMFDNPENHAYFGVRAGLNISSAANGGAFYSNKPGFEAGAIYNIPVVMNLYFEPGLSLFYNTFGTMHLQPYSTTITTPEGDPAEWSYLYQVDGTMRNLGFRIPLNIGYHFDFAPDLSVSVFTGPQLNLSLLAKYHQNEVITPDNEVVRSSSQSIFGTGGFKHLDLQWNFGIGVNWQRYYMSIGGSWGMTHMKSPSTIQAGPYQVELHNSLRRNLFYITVGYNL